MPRLQISLLLAGIILSLHSAPSNARRAMPRPEPAAIEDAQPPKTSPLVEAIRRQDLTAVRALLEQGADPNEAPMPSARPLIVALWPAGGEDWSLWAPQWAPRVSRQPVRTPQVNIDIVRALLQHGAQIGDLNARYRRPSALLLAIASGNLDLIRLLAGHGAILKVTGPDQGRPLSWAVRAGQANVVRYLLQSDIDPNGQPEMQGMDPYYTNIAMSFQDAPLHVAAAQGDLEIVRLLLDAGANLEIRRQRSRANMADTIPPPEHYGGETPLMEAARMPGNPVLPYLLHRGARIDVVNAEGETALHLAAKSGATENIKQLLNAGASVNASSQIGTTPLYIITERLAEQGYRYEQAPAAAKERYIQSLKLLLQNKANPNIESGNDLSPLSLAANSGDLETVRIFMRHGGNPYSGIKFVPKPVDGRKFAVSSRRSNALLEILERGPHLTSTYLLSRQDLKTFLAAREAAFRGEAAIVSTLLQNQKPHIREESDALEKAVLAGNPYIVEILLLRGVPVNSDSNPLTIAAREGHLETVRLLLGHGAKVDAYGEDGRTPLMETVRYGVRTDPYGLLQDLSDGGDLVHANPRLEEVNNLDAQRAWRSERRSQILSLLLAAGAQPTRRDASGCSSLHDAAPVAAPALVRRLLQQKSWTPGKVNWTDEAGNTALHLLLSHGRRATALAAKAEVARIRGDDGETRRLQEGGTPSPESLAMDAKLKQAFLEAERDDLEVIAMLLKAGADPLLSNNAGKSALDLARGNGFEAAVQLLERK